MPVRSVALIRGINVGRAKRVAMADLRTLVEDLGYRDVRTVLNSGNVVFTAGRAAGDPARRIARAMTERLGVSARVIVLDGTEFARIVDRNPLRPRAVDGSRLFVAFFDRDADPARLRPLTRADWGAEALALGDRVAYLWCAEGLLVGGLFEAVSAALGEAVTTRNANTLAKLRALIEG